MIRVRLTGNRRLIRLLSIIWRMWVLAVRIAIYPFAGFLVAMIVADRAPWWLVCMYGALIMLVAAMIESYRRSNSRLVRLLNEATMRTNEHMEKLDTHIRVIGPDGDILISRDVHHLYYVAMQRDGRARFTFDGPCTLDIIRILHPHVRSQAERLGRHIPPGYLERAPLKETGSTSG